MRTLNHHDRKARSQSSRHFPARLVWKASYGRQGRTRLRPDTFTYVKLAVRQCRANNEAPSTDKCEVRAFRPSSSSSSSCCCVLDVCDLLECYRHWLTTSWSFFTGALCIANGLISLPLKTRLRYSLLNSNDFMCIRLLYTKIIRSDGWESNLGRFIFEVRHDKSSSLIFAFECIPNIKLK